MSSERTFHFDELLGLLVDTGLQYEKTVGDNPAEEAREWLLFDFEKQLSHEQIQSLQEHAEVRFLSKGYVVLRPRDSGIRSDYRKDPTVDAGVDLFND